MIWNKRYEIFCNLLNFLYLLKKTIQMILKDLLKFETYLLTQTMFSRYVLGYLFWSITLVNYYFLGLPISQINI